MPRHAHGGYRKIRLVCERISIRQWLGPNAAINVVRISAVRPWKQWILVGHLMVKTECSIISFALFQSQNFLSGDQIWQCKQPIIVNNWCHILYLPQFWAFFHCHIWFPVTPATSSLSPTCSGWRICQSPLLEPWGMTTQAYTVSCFSLAEARLAGLPHQKFHENIISQCICWKSLNDDRWCFSALPWDIPRNSTIRSYGRAAGSLLEHEMDVIVLVKRYASDQQLSQDPATLAVSLNLLPEIIFN